MVRSEFRDNVFARDDYECRICGAKGTLDAHHITDRTEMPNGGYCMENGISLCHRCHLKAEEFHISGGTKWEKGWHPNDLYAIIDSSYQTAFLASRRLDN